MSGLTTYRQDSLPPAAQVLLERFADDFAAVHADAIDLLGQRRSSCLLLAAVAQMAGRLALLAERTGLPETALREAMEKNYEDARDEAQAFMSAETRRRGH